MRATREVGAKFGCMGRLGRARVVLFICAGCGARTPLLAPGDAGHVDASVDASVDAPIDVEPLGDACTTHCSADLHDVLDCNGNVLITCAANEGCDGTGCSAACQAAQINQSTVGCEYYAIDPDIISLGVGACFAAFVANTWTTPVTIGVDRAGFQFDLSGFARIPTGSGKALTYAPLVNGTLQPGEVAILFLARHGTLLTSCPDGVAPAVSSDPAIHGTGLGHAFHITATAPIAAYDIFPYGGGPSAATSATLLLPTSPFANNFVAVAPYDSDVVVPEAAPTLAFVATEDATSITINPTHDITAGGGVAGALAGSPVTYSLSAGQELQISQRAELTGSIIQSSKPIAVWAGATCVNIGVNDTACDSAHQQLPPLRALGSEYVAVRYRNRYDGVEETVPWRFVGTVAGTQLTFDPPVANAPTTLGRGQLAEVWSPGPFVVRSQDAAHPFYMAAYMTGADSPYSGGKSGRGDPEFVNVIPAPEFLASYTFFTDPTYPETNLVVIRKPSSVNGYDDVSLDCAGPLGGWQPIGASGYQATRIDLVRHDFAPQGQCDNGRHVMTSATPFGLTVWGWGSEQTSTQTTWVSYAYPAGASILPINNVVVTP